MPSFLHSEGARGGTPSRLAYHAAGAPSALHGPWSKILLAIRDVFSPLAARGSDANQELMAAAQESLERNALPMQLTPGLVEKRFSIKQQLSHGAHHKVMEGVHRQTLKNHALKLVSRGGRLRVTKVLDTMQVFHLISSVVDEVYCHPNYVCICFKWGMHEVDASHQLSAWIVDALVS